MERHHHQILGENKKEEKQKINEDVEPQSMQQVPSSSSSPSHEFSFTISLESTIKIPDKTPPPNPFAIDLTPADEIFFHGHLLPLHLLSHHHHQHHHHHFPAASPRSSTNSMDSFTLPMKELLPDNNTSSSKRFDLEYNDYKSQEKRGKSKSFSLFGISNWRKGYDHQKKEKGHQYYEEKRTKLKFEVSRVVKRYMRLVKPLLSFRGSNRGNNHQILRQPYSSLSGNLLVKNKRDQLRGESSSAPVTMTRNSPTNSGHLVPPTPSGTLSPISTSDSTMEELQAAIQAAIAHCKKSIATET
ncbi:hypothetical protein ACJIZ3_002577 [Penstemon smallii]|uniref:BRI1 kinase inhibitor 1 n=1 Tax=Penstemon smallii TaxID=265156 RepID=A0ABD3U6S1_9LAMI